MEAIVGLGIIEAFSYVLLYYTFIHSLNRYERKKDKIFYIAASLAVVVRLAAIVLDKEKTAVCMDIYLPCTILQTVLLLGMNVQTSNVFLQTKFGNELYFFMYLRQDRRQLYFRINSSSIHCMTS
ncbi:MAG: hypothetical protein ACLR0W_00700 [Lachnospira sp.]